ncbi:MAG: hypothetical protein ABI666_05840 [Ferruginibacter sp.]
MNPQKRSLVITAIAILLLTMNFSRLKGTECIRPIHIVTLVTLGAAIGVLLMNIMLLIKNRKD